MSKYTVELRQLDPSDGSITVTDVFDNAKVRSYTKRLNDYGSLNFTLNLNDPKARTEYLTPWVNQIWMKRDGVVVFFGPIVASSVSVQGEDEEVRVFCNSYERYLKNRYTDLSVSYSAEDAGAIAWDLINTTQNKTNGDLGISEGTITTSVNRDRSYEYGNVFDLIQDLSNVENGFDFDISHEPVGDTIDFNVYYPRKGLKRTDLQSLEYGRHILGLEEATDGLSMANNILYLGSGTGAGRPSTESLDSDSQLGYSRIEDITVRSDISEVGTLEEHASQDLRLRKVPIKAYRIMRLDPNVSPTPFEYSVGDDIRIRASKGMFNIDSYFRVVEIKVDVDDEDNDFVTPIITNAI